MDLLCMAYATPSSDEEEDKEEKQKQVHYHHIPLYRPPPTKRNRSESEYRYCQNNNKKPYSSPCLANQTAPPLVQNRYVSKRERAAMSAAVAPSARTFDPPFPTPTITTSPVVGSIDDSGLPRDILASLRRQTKVHGNKRSERQCIVLNGHINAINSIQWSQSHGHLLASAGMDQTLHVWNVWSRGHEKACVFRYHNAAIKDVRWSLQGLFLLSCGYDCSSRLVDVEKGIETQLFKEDQVVETIRFHPNDSNLFLSGGSKGLLRLWDIRVNKVVHEYCKGLGPILDIEFSADGKQFISSTDTSRSNISENNIVVWDVSRQVPLSNQVYAEAYTCPCVRYHPYDACFIAQSNGNYIAIFSARPPFKLDRYKRYEKHGVMGFPVKCNFSLDGRELASGSTDGCIYFYNYKSSELVRKIKAFEEECIDVAFHPSMPNVIASCSWTGEVSVFE